MYRGEDVDLAFSPLGFCFFYCPREGPEHQAARLVVDMVACVSQPLPSKLADAGVKGPEGLMVSHVKGRHMHPSSVFAVLLFAWRSAALSLCRLACTNRHSPRPYRAGP